MNNPLLIWTQLLTPLISLYIQIAAYKQVAVLAYKTSPTVQVYWKNKLPHGYIQIFHSRVINQHANPSGKTADTSGQRVDHVNSAIL